MKHQKSISKIPPAPPRSKDVQLVFAFKKRRTNCAEIIQIFLIPGELYTSISRYEKLKTLEGSINEPEDKRLYSAIITHVKKLNISLEEVIPF